MRRIRDILIATMLAPIWVPLLALVACVLVVMCVPVWFQSRRLHLRWKRKLAVAGRVADVKSLIGVSLQGTIIVDNPTIGCNTTMCWWTSENVEAAAPVPVPTDEDRRRFILDAKSLEHPFDRWCYDTFLSEKTGTARLVTTRRGDQLGRRLQGDSPNAKLVYTWSGPCREAELPGGNSHGGTVA